MVPPAALTEIGGEWAVYDNIKEKHVDIVDTSDARPRGLWVFGRRISNSINGKTEKKQYNNTKFIVLDSGVASS